MTRPLAPLASATIASLAAATVCAATLSWSTFTRDPRGYFLPLVALAVLVVVAGVTGRLLRLGTIGTFALQLVLGAALTSWWTAGTAVPVGPGWERLAERLDAATGSARNLAPPVPVGGDDGVAPLLIGGGLICLLFVDLLAVSLRRPTLAALGPLVVLGVPYGIHGGGVSWWVFALTAGGFLATLALHEADMVARWGRRLDESPLPAARAGAGLVGTVATALAVVVPAALPSFDLTLVDLGPGSGDGDHIEVTNPLVGLHRDLARGPDRPVALIRTDDPQPAYLRVAVLNRFGDNDWSAGDRSVPAAQQADGDMPALQGVSPWLERVEHNYSVSLSHSFESRWLPTQQHISRIRATGDWRYDRSTMDFIAGEKDLDAAGMDYTFSAVQVGFESESLRIAAPGLSAVSSSFRELPGNIDGVVEDLAKEVTAGGRTAFEKAVELQRWFRSTGNFTYTTDVALGSSPGDLVSFLSEGPDGRRGFCQQFAAAMAVMARELGIPARVAVGFLTPERVGPDEWEYSTHDLHAWPELYFNGAGWVRFEPTPPDRAANTPSYTQLLGPGQLPDARPSASANVPEDRASGGPQQAPEEAESDTADDGTGSAVAWPAVMAGIALLLLAGVAACAPAWVRRRRRAQRLAGDPEQVWAELRDSVLDLNLPWPAGRSPRASAEQLEPHLTPPGHDGLAAIVAALEATRYSTRPASGALTRELERVLESLAAGVSDGRRRRARWWPRSVVSRRARTAAQTPAVMVERELDSVG